MAAASADPSKHAQPVSTAAITASQQQQPPTLADQISARQKRKRTSYSPDDQAILEAAYLRNSKPDKAARLELVKQVALGEKEVQIWFQNRRQSSRRKSRPLLPHEVAQYQLARASNVAWHGGSVDHVDPGRGAAPSSDCTDGSASSQDSESGPQLLHGHQQADVEKAEHAVPCASKEPREAEATPHASFDVTPGSTLAAQSPMVGPGTAHPFIAREKPLFVLPRNGHVFVAQQPSNADVCSAERFTGGDRTDEAVRCRLPNVRLSMSANGTACVTSRSIFSPSPPRRRQVHLPPVHDTLYGGRKHTADLMHPAETRPPMRRASSNRSRDSRAWEFWCDKEARSDLSDKAAHEASGSAAGAIGLLRSTSRNYILRDLSRNTTFAARAGRKLAKSSLRRSNTSLGRLQAAPSASVGIVEMTSQKAKDMDPTLAVNVPGNESDKENWSPSSNSPKTPSAVEGLADPEADPEIAAFMRGRSESHRSVSSNDDLDCVQGLLSLSQGNWR